MTATHLDFEAALRDPARYFAEPQDILSDEGLDRAAKLKLLDEWERDARGLSVAEDEGLGGGEPTMLARICNARRALTGAGARTGGGATKHG